MAREQIVASYADIKLRRAHEKSRTGCVRCKQQRKKCDEVKPSCTKCIAGGHQCRYIPRGTATKDTSKDKSESPPRESFAPLADDDHVARRKSMRLASSAPYSASQRALCLRNLSSGSSYRSTRSWPPVSETGHIFSPTQLALLGHYLSHTCHTIPFDADELYVLQVGIPNLAFRSKPLMASMLALAAASKAFDLVCGSLSAFEHLEEVQQLLTSAELHYHASLHEIQASVSYLQHFEHILANAALMVLYGLASHCIRIRFTRMARLQNEKLPVSLVPEGTQWIYLIRAAHSAYVGLLHDPGHVTEEAIIERSESTTNNHILSNFDIPTLYETRVLSPEDGPSEKTRNVLFPTAVAANENSQESLDPQLQSCFLALEILSDIAITVFVDEGVKSKYSDSTFSKAEPSLDGPLSKVSPWLRTYIARVTSVEPSKPLRRTVTAFLNLVPIDYLTAVQSMLDSVSEDLEKPSSDYQDDEWLLSCPKNQLALEIFAHWLVLVMLLDGVWWIGDIGDWEMRRIISFMERKQLLTSPKESWWPKTMFSIRQDLFGASGLR